MISREFWRGKRVFLTGHTGFKGSWLSLWLTSLGAQVSGYALAPPTNPSLFELARVDGLVDHHVGDIRDLPFLQAVLRQANPDIVIHLAAQPLVRLSYAQPVDTYAINVMGTVNLLEAVRNCGGIRAVICVTSDKCYENREWDWGYRENDSMGGSDPYSGSKGCAELVTASYRASFFPSDRHAEHGVAVASARAGNVIGGGDWAADRLVPDLMRALIARQRPLLRNPHSVRPWQHVLDPLAGYLILAQHLFPEGGGAFAEGWNFGPSEDDAWPVNRLTDRLCALWGGDCSWDASGSPQLREAGTLRLDCAKARHRLGWGPTWRLSDALAEVVAFNKALLDEADMREVAFKHIALFESGQTCAEEVLSLA
ncbi:CDP-glucose 4,6-dehydratase [Telmatospirillum siberiense]|uniref:CDP-glucose 4,6-dehydratase n=1 Tax=Telmatospirillum siberiense TaxID=382514 RepID=A0A2N3Q015_9PROT|nr:CDP-glucose 4,6-dehydratase [Telmatospirillum siberiense]PKU25989.1 CDP-glucose 4,6-dehydratase [Telmatospirillum siberiense]